MQTFWTVLVGSALALNSAFAAAAAETNAATGPASAAPANSPGRGDQELEITIAENPGHVVIPPRPGWVESPPVREGELHTTAVSSLPQETPAECRSALEERLKAAVDQYVDEYLAGEWAVPLKASRLVRYDLPYIRQRLIRPDEIYDEEVQVSFGPMHQRHALVRFDAAFRQELDGRRGDLSRYARQLLVRGRLWAAALAFAGVLSLLAVVCGVWRVNHATRGSYRGRLRWIAAAAILGLVLVGVLLARQIPWV